MDWDVLLALVLAWGLVGISGVSLAVAVWSLRWPSVKGVVEVSFVDQTPNEKGYSETHELAYSYTVHGNRFLGSNIKPWGGGGSTFVDSDSDKVLWSGARDAARWYRPGVTVDVYYCPLRPAWSCLEPGGFIIPIFLGGVALVLYWLVVR